MKQPGKNTIHEILNFYELYEKITLEGKEREKLQESFLLKPKIIIKKLNNKNNRYISLMLVQRLKYKSIIKAILNEFKFNFIYVVYKLISEHALFSLLWFPLQNSKILSASFLLPCINHFLYFYHTIYINS